MSSVPSYIQRGAALSVLLISIWLLSAPLFATFNSAIGKMASFSARKEYISDLETRLETAKHSHQSVQRQLASLNYYLDRTDQRQAHINALSDTCQKAAAIIIPESGEQNSSCTFSNRPIAEGWEIQTAQLSISGEIANIFSALEHLNSVSWVLNDMHISTDSRTDGSYGTLNVTIGALVKTETSEAQ